MKKLLVLILSIAAAFCAVFALTACGVNTESQMRSFAESAAKQIIAESLKSPSTAIWNEISYMENNDDGQYVVYVDVEATNSFNAYSRNKYFVIVQNINPKENTFSYNRNLAFIDCTGKNDSVKLMVIKKLNNYNGNTESSPSSGGSQGGSSSGSGSGSSESSGSGSSGGGETPSTHTHVYTKQVAKYDYLKLPATCTQQAVYYYSCECGDYTYGKTFSYGEPLPHNYNMQDTSDKYFKSPATCAQKATYYYSCKCGKKSTETFTCGETLPHTFNKQVATDEYIKSPATCAQKAIYYYSCECGENGYNDTFTYGETLPHTFDKQVATDEYIKSPATCTQKATYYYSCECGEKSPDTFTYGETLPHNYNDRYVCTVCGYECRSEGLEFTLSSDGNSYICTGMGSFDGEILKIPDSYNGKPVTSIAQEAFAYKFITDAFIPDSVISIGDSAFYKCSKLKKVNIGNGVKDIGNGTFDYCVWLEYTFYNNCKYLGNYQNKYLWLITTASQDITNCDINKSCRFIKKRSFYNCNSLKNVTIPNGVTYIGDDAFNGCISITNITIPNSLTQMGSQVFYGCNYLETVEIPGYLTNISPYTFYGCYNLKNVKIGSGVKSIGYGAFNHCQSIETIEIPNTVTEIDSWAFAYCTSLTAIVLPDKLTTICNNTFYNCTYLKSVNMGKEITDIGSHAFDDCNLLRTINYKGTKTQWNEINKGYYWKYDIGKISIICSDGTIKV